MENSEKVILIKGNTPASLEASDLELNVFNNCLLSFQHKSDRMLSLWKTSPSPKVTANNRKKIKKSSIFVSIDGFQPGFRQFSLGVPPLVIQTLILFY